MFRFALLARCLGCRFFVQARSIGEHLLEVDGMGQPGYDVCFIVDRCQARKGREGVRQGRPFVL